MNNDEPKTKHQRCKICDHCLLIDYYYGDKGYWCWYGDLKEINPKDYCMHWTWNGIDEK